ncbi:hypothetical protein MUN81_15295 [Hymenobacter sp. 5317J-9]|uniref:hypothetical protein n=1 Tax=Hymenobacter sp. 5317J-9 TaxID=2932250 RepID=UPI001FD65DA4|nr:hypothetical protein [Hymenobacter sp. 5317J-9]UOQ96600.1 hypothetical protein MUN81_15295 [Hymenobacter sp. 5317J-9]
MRKSLLLVALSLACCAAPRPIFEPDPAPVSTPLALDSLAQLPPYLVPAPAGSTPRQKRQWQKAQAVNLARAGVLPAKLKNSSLAQGPGAMATTVTRPRAPVATGAGSATDNRKAGQRGGAPAIGDGAHAELTTESGLSYWWLLVPVAGLAWWKRRWLVGRLG